MADPTQADPGALGAILDALGDDSHSTTLYRHELGSGKVFVDHVDLSACTSPGEVLTVLRARYGGGKYTLQLHKQPGWQYIKQTTFAIAGDPKPLDGGKAEDNGAPPPEAARLDRIERMIEDLARGGGGGDRSGELMALATSMSTSMMAAITPLLGAVAEQKAASGAELVRVLKSGIELGRMTGGQDAGNGDPYASMFRTLLERLPAGVGGPAENPPSSGGLPPGAGEELPHHIAAVAPYLPQLALSIGEGREVEDVADAVAAVLAPVVVDALTSDPNAVPRLVGVCPELGPHRGFLRKLLEELREDPEEEEEDDPGEEGAAGAADSK